MFIISSWKLCRLTGCLTALRATLKTHYVKQQRRRQVTLYIRFSYNTIVSFYRDPYRNMLIVRATSSSRAFVVEEKTMAQPQISEDSFPTLAQSNNLAMKNHFPPCALVFHHKYIVETPKESKENQVAFESNNNTINTYSVCLGSSRHCQYSERLLCDIKCEEEKSHNISSASSRAVANAPTFQTNYCQNLTMAGNEFKNNVRKILNADERSQPQCCIEVGKLYSTGVRAEKVIWSEQLHNRRYEIAIITSSASTSSFEEEEDDDDDDDDDYVCNIK
uniref:Ig-like domain-containing protein n=1 Tax=Glossina pallidipes TaxID=7398 RepID=A0A1B0AH39_GLOPL